MTSKWPRTRWGRIGFLSLCVLMVMTVGWAACDDDQTCKSSAECGTGEICGGAGAGPFHCLKDCTTDGACPLGYACRGVTNADCPTCDVITNACVAQLRL